METISVGVTDVHREFQRSPLGINVNYFMDGGDRLHTLPDALGQLNVSFLRFPGGEKSDAHLWSVPPFDACRPTLARHGPGEVSVAFKPFIQEDGKTLVPDALTFDQFIELCRDIGAEPVLVVAYDSMYKPAALGATRPTRDQLLATAREWVRYANVRHDYGATYWEIGNESYINAYNGYAAAEQYAEDLVAFSHAMKGVDPTIRIGANGPASKDSVGAQDREAGTIWWKKVLERASDSFDFLAVHDYPCHEWGGFEYYQEHAPRLGTVVDEAATAIEAWGSPEDVERLGIMITELNSADWASDGWPQINTLGHAIVLFDMLGSYLCDPRVDAALLWNTRWVSNVPPAERRLWDALDLDDELQGTGHIMRIWGRFLGSQMVHADSTDAIKAFASYEPSNGCASVFLINRHADAREVRVAVGGMETDGPAQGWVFTGRNPEDTNPVSGGLGVLPFDGEGVALELEPLSITVLTVGS